MPNLIDILSDEDKAKVASWKANRLDRKHPDDVPPYLYALAELGYYYGWQAIEAVKRGYILSIEEDGSIRRIPFTMDEMYGLLMAAQKVKYRKMIEEGDIQFSAFFANNGNFKRPGKVYDRQIKAFRERAR